MRFRWIRLLMAKGDTWTCPWCRATITEGDNNKEFGHEPWCGGG